MSVQSEDQMKESSNIDTTIEDKSYAGKNCNKKVIFLAVKTNLAVNLYSFHIIF